MDFGSVINPLPSEYDLLSKEDQRAERLRVVRDHSTPQRFQLAWACFREWYLKPSEDFYKAQMESPAFHYDIPRSVAKNRRNIIAAPRGSAKSTVCSEELPIFLALTRTNRFDITICTATSSMGEDRITRIMNQVENNPMILEDFGKQKPKRGGGKWNMSSLEFENGNSIRCTSVTSKKRGARPDLLIFDDPEYDPSGEQSAEELSKSFETLLFKIFLPMLERGSGILWIGTMISRRSFLYKACSGEDKRFELWDRKILAAAELAPGSSLNDEEPTFVNFLWPEKWSQGELIMRLRESGPAHFSSEYLNAPTTHDDRLLYIDDNKNTYFVSGGIPENPFDSDGSKIVYKAVTETCHHYCMQEKTYNEWVRGLFRIILVDYAYTQKSYSDFSCCVCVGFDNHDVAWVLDCWHGKVTSDGLNGQIVRMGSKWQAHLVCPEAVSIQKELAERTAHFIQDATVITNWTPRVLPPEFPSGTGKAGKIAAMEWRYKRGRIKFPMNKEFSEDDVHFRTMYSQIADFTMDLSLLPHDDVVDTLGMLSFVKRGKIVPKDYEPVVKDIGDRVKGGERFFSDEVQIPLISAMSSREIDDVVVGGMIKGEDKWNNRRRPRRRLRRRLM